MRGLLYVAGIAVLLTLPHASTGQDKAGDVRAILQSKDFWDKDGKKGGRKWSDAEQTQLAELKKAGEDDVIRLRAYRVLVELAGKASYNVDKDDDVVAVAGFKYLEANIKDPQVAKMLDEGITHYHVSLNTTQGSVWLLIENVGNKGSGGLNLRWDGEKKTIVKMVAWGSVK